MHGVEQLPGDNGIQICRLARRLGQVPAVGERVGGRDEDEHRARELTEGELHRLVHRSFGAERLDRARSTLPELSLEVAGRVIGVAPARSGSGLGGDGEVPGTADDVIDEIAYRPRDAGRGQLHLVVGDVRQHAGGRRERPSEKICTHVSRASSGFGGG